MSVNGKQKGNSFERKISKKLSERFKEYTGLEQSFRRNIDSGSFFGGSNKFRTKTHDLDKATFGDIVVPEKFKFSLECKFYKTGPTLAAIAKQEIKQWDTWLAQAKQDADNAELILALIIKYNGIEELVILDKNYPTLNAIILYKQYFVYTLDNFLSLPDIEFFN